MRPTSNVVSPCAGASAHADREEQRRIARAIANSRDAETDGA